jgi:hypothetical protein
MKFLNLMALDFVGFCHRITGFLDFSHRSVFWGVEIRRFGNWVRFRPQLKWGEKTYTHLGPLERANLNMALALITNFERSADHKCIRMNENMNV